MSFIDFHYNILKLLFRNLAEEYSEKKTISTKTLNELDHFFRAPLQPALRLVDRRRVKRFTCPRGRVVYQVAGEARAFYTCLPSSNFCACYSYLHQVKVVYDAYSNLCLANFVEMHCHDIVHITRDHRTLQSVIILRRQEIPMCKHVLASRLAEALGTCDSVNCTDETMMFLLQGLS